MLLLGARVRVRVEEDRSLDGSLGSVMTTPEATPYYGVALDKPPSWILRMFPDGIIPFTEEELDRICG